MSTDLTHVVTNGDVREVAIIIRKAGDGLSEALKVAPIALDHGDVCFFLLKGTVTKVAFAEVKPGSEDLRRVHSIDTISITQVDAEMAEPILRDAAVAVRIKLDELAGAVPLFAPGEGPMAFEDLSAEGKALWIAHGNGAHMAGPVPECPSCEAPSLRSDRRTDGDDEE